MRLHRLAALALMATTCSHAPAAGPYTFTPIMTSNTPLPQISQFDGTLGAPVLNDRGQVAYRGTRDRGLTLGVYLGSCGQLTTIHVAAESGEFIYPPSINNLGQVAFGHRAPLGSGAGIRISRGEAGGLTTIVESRPAGPIIGLFNFADGTVSLNNQGMVAFGAYNPQGIFRSDGEDLITVALATDGNALLGTSIGSCDVLSLNESNQVAFYAEALPNQKLIIRGSNSGDLVLLQNQQFVTGRGSMNDGNVVAFQGIHPPGTGQRHILYGAATPLTIWAATLGSGEGLGTRPSINDGGIIAYLLGSGGLGHILIGPDRVNDLVIRAGMTLPGSGLGNTVTQLYITGEALNKHGQIAFGAKLSNGVTGIFRADPPVGAPAADFDEDGVANQFDNCPSVYNPDQANLDGDGAGNACDGCPEDAGRTFPNRCGCGMEEVDSDFDGTPDCLDNCPTDPNKAEPGECGCFIPDSPGCGVACEPPFDADSDNDGTQDCHDGCPFDANKTAPGDCGCGHAEQPGCMICQDDTDNDGTPDCFDSCPTDINKTDPGSCGCGNSDEGECPGCQAPLDGDSDNDGTQDCYDACPNDPNKSFLDPSSCGCGTPDDDLDFDAIPDCIDACPADSSKSAPGACGCGIDELDSDSDSTPNCIDNCPFVSGASQADSDSDGVGALCDACPGTIPGGDVDDTGCPPAIPGDFDRDGDVDIDDVTALSACRSGATVPAATGCLSKDLDFDDDVDQDDFAIVQRCHSGENIPADPACGG